MAIELGRGQVAEPGVNLLVHVLYQLFDLYVGIIIVVNITEVNLPFVDSAHEPFRVVDLYSSLTSAIVTFAQ